MKKFREKTVSILKSGGNKFEEGVSKIRNKTLLLAGFALVAGCVELRELPAAFLNLEALSLNDNTDKTKKEKTPKKVEEFHTLMMSVCSESKPSEVSVVGQKEADIKKIMENNPDFQNVCNQLLTKVYGLNIEHSYSNAEFTRIMNLLKSSSNPEESEKDSKFWIVFSVTLGIVVSLGGIWLSMIKRYKKK